ncbi:MAG: DNA translocase FtsK 4TM domain-containing protein [Burkholderiales bacterium]|nr:DNA translocase FtsK 4TM domain-containing protein [Burkholderiales bacterium]
MKSSVKPSNPKFATKNRTTLLPSNAAIALNYVQAVVFFALASVIAVMLYSYSLNDGGWSRSTDTSFVHNLCGMLGAFISDICYSLFGYSSWWFVIIFFYIGIRKILRDKIVPGSLGTINKVIFFFVLVISSSALEFMLNYGVKTIILPNNFGGVLGAFIVLSIYQQTGEVALSIMLLFITILSFSLVFAIRWLLIAEKIGAAIMFIYSGMSKAIGNNSIDIITKDKFEINSVNDNNNIQMTNYVEDVKDNPPDKSQLDLNHVIFDNDSHSDTRIIYNEQTHQEENVVENDFQDPFIINDNNVSQNKLHDDYQDNTHKEVINEKYTVNYANNLHERNSADVFFSSSTSINHSKHITPQVSIADKAGLYQDDLLNESNLPSTSLLHMPSLNQETVSQEVIEFVSKKIESALSDFGIEITICNVESGPVITRYELTPPRGIKGEKIAGYAKEIARSLALPSVRIVENIIGKNTMGIEVSNFKRQTIFLKEVFESRIYKENNSLLTLALGKDIAGQVVVTDLAKMPHLLVAGTTGSGKSVSVNAMILSILFNATAEEVKFIMIDPKMVELSFYQDIPHLLAPVVTDMSQAANALKWTVGEMERRYRLMAKVGTKKINDFNSKIEKAKKDGKPLFNPFSEDLSNPEPLDKWPFIVVIIDELADLMMVEGKKIEQYIARLAQKARAVGIHLIVATQRPSTDVITGLIKSNIPARISFQLPAAQDSRIILNGQNGAEALLGQGDMLFLAPGSGFAKRIHGAFINDDELYEIVEYLKEQGAPNYNDEILSGEVDVVIPGVEDDSQAGSYDSSIIEKDPIFDIAVKFMLDSKKCSISSLQTNFGIGYNKAARIFAHLEKIGMVRRNERGGFELLNHVIK